MSAELNRAFTVIAAVTRLIAAGGLTFTSTQGSTRPLNVPSATNAMNEDLGKEKQKRGRRRLAGVIGAFLGGAAAFGVGKLFPFESFWLGLLLLSAGIAIGGVLGQMVASR